MNEENRAKLLIVDDSPENLDMLMESLGERYAVVAARNGVKALELAHREPKPDIILLDIMMPGMDGYQVCKQLKSDGDTCEIPVIFITALSDNINELKGLEIGAADYIIKPFSLPIIQARIAMQLELQLAKKMLQNQVKSLTELEQIRKHNDQILRHDLKDPIAPIIHFSKNIQHDENINEYQREKLEMIHMAGTKIVDLINYYHDIFLMESNSYTYNPDNVSVLPIINEVAEELQPFLDRKLVTISIDGDSENIIAARNFIVTIFQELLRSVITFTPSNTAISINLYKEQLMGVIEIHSEGVLGDEFVAEYFNKYSDIAAGVITRFGCYSARLMVEAMHGDINIISSHDSGTKITVKIPAHPGTEN